MTEIVVRFRGGEHRFTPEQAPVTIGRSPTCSVVADAQAVSGTHAQLTFESDQWVYRDQSTNGTYVNDVPVNAFSITAPVTAVLGNYEDGEVIELVPGLAQPNAPAPPMGAPPMGGAPMSSIHSTTQMMPKEIGGGPSTAPPGQTAGQDIRIQYLGEEYIAHPGQTVRFGRDPSNEIQLDNPTVSRHHAQLTYGPKGWRLDDTNSSRGLTADGQQTHQVELRGTTEVWLGPEEAGVRVVFVAPGVSKKKAGGLSPVAVVVPVVAVLLIALVAIAFVARSRSGEPTTPTTGVPTADLIALKKGTVRVEVKLRLSGDIKDRVEREKRAQGQPLDAPELWGSGTIISPDGLVLTNAHVATPDKVSEAGTKLPPAQSIKVVRNREGSDEQLTETEDAELVVADPKVDLAIIKIQGASNLPYVPIGADSSVKAGEDVLILGFPGTADTKAVTVTAGKVSSFIPDKKLGVDRAWINTDAKFEQGNSGGLAANKEGKIIGIPTGTCYESVMKGESGGPIAQQNRIRTIDLAQDLINAAKGDPDSYETKTPDEDVCATGKTTTTRSR